MAKLSQTDKLTALELAKRINGNDEKLIIEALSQTNQIMLDMPWYEANEGTIHNTVIRTSLPKGTHRKYNQGVKPEASTTKTQKDIIEMIGAYCPIDRDLVDHSGDKQFVLDSESKSFISGMGNTCAEDLIYGDNSTNDTVFSGFAARYASLTDKDNVFSCGATGSNCTSVFLVSMGYDLAGLIYPKGNKSLGVRREDRGVVDWEDGEGNKYPAYLQYFSAQFGLTIRDPKAVKRVCNIKTAGTGATEPAVLVSIIRKAIRSLPERAKTVALYANWEVLAMLDEAASAKANVVYYQEDPWGDVTTHVGPARCRTVNAILNTETALA